MAGTVQVTGLQWWEYRQNNTGGSFSYDPQSGISVNVYVQARDPSEADFRAKEIGLYWDGCDSGQDCSCCGDRWYPQSYYGTPVEDVPPPDKVWAPEFSYASKWIANGYETFVHNYDGSFYGTDFSGTIAEVI